MRSFSFQIFPFSIVFNKDMMITNMGHTLNTLYGRDSLRGKDIRLCFKLRRPRMKFSWENVRNFIPELSLSQ